MSPAKYLLLSLSLILISGEGVQVTEAKSSEVMHIKKIQENGIDGEFLFPFHGSTTLKMITWPSGFAYGDPRKNEAALYSPKTGEVIEIRKKGPSCTRLVYEDPIKVTFENASNCAEIVKEAGVQIDKVKGNEITNYHEQQGPIVATRRNNGRQ